MAAGVACARCFESGIYNVDEDHTRIILGVLFYVLILPMGLIMRLFGNDPMARKWDKSAESYRVESVREPKERLEKPF